MTNFIIENFDKNAEWLKNYKFVIKDIYSTIPTPLNETAFYSSEKEILNVLFENLKYSNNPVYISFQNPYYFVECLIFEAAYEAEARPYFFYGKNKIEEKVNELQFSNKIIERIEIELE